MLFIGVLMALLFPAGYQFFDSNGDPLSAGTINFYETGTTTDKATYSDNEMSTETANPYSLDSAGRLAVNLYGAGTYTVKVNNSSAAQVFSRDDVFGWGGDGTTQILATSGDAGDQTTVIQDYLTNYRDLHLPAGTYRYATTLEIPANTAIRGPGKLHYTGTDDAVELMGDNISIEGITVYSDNAASYDNGHRGIQGQLTTFSPLTVSYFDNIQIKDVTIYGFGDTGIRIDWIRDSRIQDCYIHDCAYGGIILLSPSNVHIKGNQIQDITPGGAGDTGYGISLSRASEATISGVPNTAISTTNAPEPTNCIISHNIIDGVPSYTGIDLHSARSVTIANNVTNECQVSVNLEHATSGAEVAGVSDVTIIGNSFGGITSSKSPGILIDAQSGAGEIAYAIAISGNTFREHGLSVASLYESDNGGVIYVRDVDGLTISNNVFDTSYGRCISLDQGTRSCTIQGNTFVRLTSENSTQTAIELISTSARAVIIGNQLHSSAGMLFESAAPLSTYGAWLGDNMVSNGATLSDATSYARAKRIRLFGSTTYDPASLNDGQRAEADVTVTGAIIGDYAQASFGVDTVGLIVNALVTASNVVTVTFHNESGGVVDLASSTLSVMVTRDSA